MARSANHSKTNPSDLDGTLRSLKNLISEDPTCVAASAHLDPAVPTLTNVVEGHIGEQHDMFDRLTSREHDAARDARINAPVAEDGPPVLVNEQVSSRSAAPTDNADIATSTTTPLINQDLGPIARRAGNARAQLARRWSPIKTQETSVDSTPSPAVADTSARLEMQRLARRTTARAIAARAAMTRVAIRDTEHRLQTAKEAAAKEAAAKEAAAKEAAAKEVAAKEAAAKEAAAKEAAAKEAAAKEVAAKEAAAKETAAKETAAKDVSAKDAAEREAARLESIANASRMAQSGSTVSVQSKAPGLKPASPTPAAKPHDETTEDDDANWIDDIPGLIAARVGRKSFPIDPDKAFPGMLFAGGPERPELDGDAAPGGFLPGSVDARPYAEFGINELPHGDGMSDDMADEPSALPASAPVFQQFVSSEPGLMDQLAHATDTARSKPMDPELAREIRTALGGLLREWKDADRVTGE